MYSRQRVARALAATTSTVLLSAGLVGLSTGPATAAKTASARYLLNQLDTASEHLAGYDRDMFTHWVDADGDGCDARDEVLLAEAVRKPSSRSGCDLIGGSWFSRYDGVRTTNPSTFDVDHMVPLHEAWQSGASRWSSTKRKAFANDLGYKWSLVAVTASSNRSKSDREPQDWLPARGQCKYVAQWVAVKWRWNLTVNQAEKRFLRSELRTCGWPRVAKPTKAKVSAGSSGGGSGGGTGGVGGGACAPGYSPCIPPYPPDVDCADVDGPIYVTGSDPHGLDGDGDGVACE